MTGDAITQRLTDEQFERWMDLREREIGQRDEDISVHFRTKAMEWAFSFHGFAGSYRFEKEPADLAAIFATYTEIAERLSSDTT